MNKFSYFLLRLLFYFPFTQFIFKQFYRVGINRIKDRFENHEHLKDILLTSDTKAKDFIYGLSDLNFLIIVDNEVHPKTVLTEFRTFVNQHLLLRLIVHEKYLPILTSDELKTDVIKSYLIRNSAGDSITWYSILTKTPYKFQLKEQDYFAISYSSVQTLDYYLLRPIHTKNKRIQFKNVYNALRGLERLHKTHFKNNRKWSKRYLLSQRFPFLLGVMQRRLFHDTWRFLTDEPRKKQGKFNQKAPLDKHLKKYLESIYNLPFIDNIIIIPSMLKSKRSDLKGKVYFDVVINQLSLKKLNNLRKIRKEVRSFDTESIKYRVRFTTTPLHILQNTKALFPFPLETIYRNKKAHSLIGNNEEINISTDSIHHSSVHFLVTQFMRFRSLEQKTDLIGSKFIKSLNLMYKYYTLNYYLKGNDVEFLGDVSIIREHLTPQFSSIKNMDIVTEEHWILIRAQLLYLLKSIRNELAKKDPELKKLMF